MEMKIAHLILTHKSPKQLERLIVALDHSGFDFYIHLDKKVNADPFLYLANKGNVFFIKERAKIYWAGYGTIQATINGFEEIIRTGKYDYINVISGQDFPIKPAHYIFNYINSKKGNEFITCESLEREWKEALPRVRKYHLINWNIPGRFRLEKIANAFLPEREFPLDFQLVGRANWFTLTTGACAYILEFLNKHPEVNRFFKYSWGADEIIFSTVLFNSSYQKNITDNLVYVDWTGQKHGHPRILTIADLDKLKCSDKLFARKFDSEKDNEIIVKLEEFINEKNVLADN